MQNGHGNRPARRPSDPAMGNYSSRPDRTGANTRGRQAPNTGGTDRLHRQAPPREGNYQNSRSKGYDPRLRSDGYPPQRGKPRKTAAEERFDRERAEYLRRVREKEALEERRRRAEYERRRAEAREARRRLEEEIRRENKLRRKRERRIFLGRALVSIVISAILLTVTGFSLALHFNSAPHSPDNSVTYTYGGEEVRVADGTTAHRGGRTYVCFSDVADYLGLATTGGTESIKFVFADPSLDSEGEAGEDFVIFMTDSRTVSINSQLMTLPRDSFFYGEDIWVCTDFIEDFMTNITVEVTSDTVAISRLKDEENSTDEETVYLPVSLKLKEAVATPDTTEDEDPNGGTANLELTFETDLAEYEEFMDPENADEYLILVNTASRLDGTYAPTDLVEIVNTRQDDRETQLLRNTAAKALEALFIEMQAAGYTDVSVTSGYRSYEAQEYLHYYYIEQEMQNDPSLTWDAAVALVSAYSAEAGTSEHQTGLCVDMHNLPSATTEFANEDAYKWLTENAWKFGFILRFPEGKTNFTGISFEPWHWRFVGREAAKEIYSEGICLEEYISSLNV